MNHPVTAEKQQRANDGKRLDADIWAETGLLELAEHGIDGVRVEVLAKRLSVTKGSFYWHFKNREALLAAMLDRWRKRATLALIERLDSIEVPPEQRLKELLHLPLKGSKSERAADVELAIRLWSRRDKKVREILNEVDELRLRYLARLLCDCGIPAEAARARAVLAYAYQRVAGSLTALTEADLSRDCENILMGKN